MAGQTSAVRAAVAVLAIAVIASAIADSRILSQIDGSEHGVAASAAATHPFDMSRSAVLGGSNHSLLANISVPCNEGFNFILTEVKNKLKNESNSLVPYENAMQVFQANARYPGDPGNYDGCMAAGGAQFWLVEAFTPAFGLFANYSSASSSGFCLPKQCTQADVEFMTPYLFLTLMRVDHTRLVAAKALKPHTLEGAGAIFLTIFLIVLAILCLTATILRAYKKHQQTKFRSHMTVNDGDEHAELIPKASGAAHMQQMQRDAGKKREKDSLLYAFDLAANWRDLMKSPGINDGLKSLDGMKVLSMLWIILGHTSIHEEAMVDNIIYDIRDTQSSWTAQFIFAAESAVDTFFAASGFLATYLFLEAFAKQKAHAAQSGKPAREPNLVGWSCLVYFHRYLRLTPLYFAAIMFWTYVLPLTSQGPFWDNLFATQVDTPAPCRQYWWTNMLYINNLYPDQFSGRASGGLGCMSWSWYLANDTQLFLLLPFLAKLHSKHRRAAWVTVTLLIIGSIVSRGWLQIAYSITECLGASDLSGADQARGQTVVYNKPYTRAVPYLLGIALAYFYSEQGGAKNTRKLNIPRPWIAAGWVAFTGTVLAVFYGTSGMRSDNPYTAGECEWNNTQMFFSITFTSLAWGLAMLWVIFCGLFGYGGIVTRFLAHKAWTPLSRLVYGAYLVHPMIIYALYYSGNQKTDFYPYRLSLDFLGFAVGAFVVATVGHLLIEKPFNNLQKVLLPAGR